MPRKSKKKAAKPKGETYFKAKNGRFYKQVKIDGVTRCRFVSNAEATGTIKTASKSSKPKRTRKKVSTKPQPSLPKQEEPAPSVNEPTEE